MRLHIMFDMCMDMGPVECKGASNHVLLFNCAQVIQTYARANKLPLDVMMFTTEVTNKTVEQVTEAAPLGCYIHGCVLEGARCAAWHNNILLSSWALSLAYVMCHGTFRLHIVPIACNMLLT